MAIEVSHDNNSENADIDQNVVEVVFVESYDHFHQKQAHSQYERKLQRPTILSLRRHISEYPA